MLGRPLCSGEKPPPYPVTGYLSKTTKNPFLLLPHHLHLHQPITPYPQLPLFSMTISSPLPLVCSVTVVHLASRTSQPTTHVMEPHPTCPRLTPLVPLPLIHAFPLVISEVLGMVQKHYKTRYSKPSCGSA